MRSASCSIQARLRVKCQPPRHRCDLFLVHTGAAVESAAARAKAKAKTQARAAKKAARGVASKGSVDTGIINQGDYYTRTVSGSYTNFSFSNLKLKWTFI